MMRLVRFKCININCQRDFYCCRADIAIVLAGYPDGWPLCPFCEEYRGALEIGIVQFDDKSVIEKDMINDVVTVFRKEMEALEGILYKLENLTPVMEEEDE